jgi:hypothetical protein
MYIINKLKITLTDKYCSILQNKMIKNRKVKMMMGIGLIGTELWFEPKHLQYLSDDGDGKMKTNFHSFRQGLLFHEKLVYHSPLAKSPESGPNYHDLNYIIYMLCRGQGMDLSVYIFPYFKMEVIIYFITYSNEHVCVCV